MNKLQKVINTYFVIRSLKRNPLYSLLIGEWDVVPAMWLIWYISKNIEPLQFDPVSLSKDHDALAEFLKELDEEITPFTYEVSRFYDENNDIDEQDLDEDI